MSYGNLSVDSITTSTPQGVLGAGNASLMKNRIINGAMVIDQRNSGGSLTFGAGSAYTVDRWFGTATAANKFSVQQNAGALTPFVGFSNYLGVTSLTAYSVASGDTFYLQQSIEGFNTADLGFGTANAKQVTLSFQVYSSLTGTFGGALINGAGNRNYPFSFSIPVANTATTISIPISGDVSGTWVGATNGMGLGVRFGLGSGSTYSGTAGAWATGNYVQPTGTVSVVGTNGATFYITGVQLEVGSVATGFEYRQYGTELALCQRYYQKLLGNSNDNNWFNGLAFSATTGICAFMWNQQMRTSPTLTFNGTYEALGNGVVNSATLAYSETTPFSTQVGVTTTGLTAGGGVLIRTGTGNSSVEISAEL